MTPLDRRMLAGSWRRWWNLEAPDVGPPWLHLVWTGLFSAAMAALFTVLFWLLGARMAGDNGESWRSVQGWLHWYGQALTFALTIGYIVHLLFRLARRRLGAARVRALAGWRRSVFFTAIPLAGTFIGWPIAFWLVGGQWQWLRNVGPIVVLQFVAIGLGVSLLIHVAFMLAVRRIAERMRAAEARLKLLQAQVEPHFLFNTLANLHSLMDHDVPRAKAMLETFIEYLRGALGQIRAERTSVGAELDLARAYLELMAARMGERLRFSIDADAAVRDLSILPMLLQPLVENAIRHGLEPKREGGSVHIEARAAAGRLTLLVRDDGLGLSPDASARGAVPPVRRGAGVALDNLRARLAARYGGEARFDLQPAVQPAGTLARIELPA
jgi:two-component sensor histidine kinase